MPTIARSTAKNGRIPHARRVGDTRRLLDALAATAGYLASTAGSLPNAPSLRWRSKSRASSA